MIQCGLCEEFPCERLGKMGDFSDLSTNHAKERNSRRIATEGMRNGMSNIKNVPIYLPWRLPDIIIVE